LTRATELAVMGDDVGVCEVLLPKTGSGAVRLWYAYLLPPIATLELA
jgi:hypothetical protein